MIIWLARAMTSAQCCQSSMPGTVVVVSSVMAVLILVIASANAMQSIGEDDMNPPQLLPDALVMLDYVGIAVFAVSGALLAAEKKQTLVTFIFFAVITGVGGGTMRDLLIGAPVFWVHTNATLLICIGAALGVWFLSRRAIAERALLWFDAVGLAAYATYGAAKALNYGVAPVPAFAMGVMTACVGGIIRDVLADEPSILMRPELYVTAAALASGLFVILALCRRAARAGRAGCRAGGILACAARPLRAA